MIKYLIARTFNVFRANKWLSYAFQRDTFNPLNRLILFNRVNPSKLRRKPPLSVQSEEGLEKAHILSLYLVSRLWQQVHGHQFISSKDLKALKVMLNRKENFESTCMFANRTLHVKYDREIANAILKDQQNLSPAAEMRVNQVIKVLLMQIRDEDARLKKFAHKSIVILGRLLN